MWKAKEWEKLIIQQIFIEEPLWVQVLYLRYKMLEIQKWPRHNVLVCFSHVWFSVTPWTVAGWEPLFMEFSRQEYWWVAIPFSRGSFWPRDQTCVYYSQLDQSPGMIYVSSLGNNVDERVTVLSDSAKTYN